MDRRLGFLRVGAACTVVKVAAVEENLGRILSTARDLDCRMCDLVVFPELCFTGYTCADLFHQDALLTAAIDALARFADATAELTALFVVGLPVRVDGQLCNAAVCVQAGRILGAVPKTYLPGYNEFYEPRWFAGGQDIARDSVRLAGQIVPFGTDLLFESEDGDVTFGVELCEDLWAPIPPSTYLALGGAQVILNPSASNELVGKVEYRRELLRQQSARCLCAYAYASSGMGESTTDVVYGGHGLVAENGLILAENRRFEVEPRAVVADIDVEFLNRERLHNRTFSDCLAVTGAAGPGAGRRIQFTVASRQIAGPDLMRTVNPRPFVPAALETRRERCREILSIQSAGLAARLRHTGIGDAVIGLSGGLDSTLALLVTVDAFARCGLDRQRIHALTLPGFGTSDRTLANVRALCAGLSLELTQIDIRESCELHLRDIGHDGTTHDVTFENVQARERTQILMDRANLVNGLVVGTGDLSELALGWCTYNGDHMSMYGVNAGVPKTLVRFVIEFAADQDAFAPVSAVLRDILDTPISPELLPPDADGEITQRTEDVIGPYELHDFFLYHLVRCGRAPSKVLFLAECAFREHYDSGTIRKWLRVFLKRFFSQQFKRSCLPDGPKVGSVALSPRGDWRMPSDASADAWLKDLDGALESGVGED